jgi:CheY-like chemotaxis protein
MVDDPRIRVFLLDDHEIVRRGVRELLEAESDIEVVGEAETAEQALRRIPPTRPAVAVLDVRLPDGDGVTVCREIRSAHPEIACLMLTSFADDDALPEEDERLTRQERKILMLIADGLAKLGMERRTQAAVFAARLPQDPEPPLR